MTRSALVFVAAFLAGAASAQATQQGQQTLRNWKVMDNCAKQAQAAYPDFSADSNTKRDAKLKECLSNGALPPREPIAQPGSRQPALGR
jgi:hypothetical protein